MQRSLLYQLGSRDSGRLDRFSEEAALAEGLGFGSLWCLPESGAAGDFKGGAPEFWLASLADRTDRLRLGWGLAGHAPPQRPPIRTAEQAASLDLACKGRLEIALLPDPALDRAEGDAASPDMNPDWDSDWEEGIRMLVDMWDGPRFSWTSPRFEVPPVDVLPKPVQTPHPPLWLVGWSLHHARHAGRAGLGFLDVSGAEDDVLEMHRDAYRSGRAESDPHLLVCVSVYAALLGAESDAKLVERVARWEGLGFDQAVLRIDPAVDDAATTALRIRSLAGESAVIQ